MTEKLSQFLSAPTAPALTDGVPASTYAGTPDSTKNYQWSLEQIGESLAAGGLTRTILTGNLNLYQDSTLGSDLYNGLSATYTGGNNGPTYTIQAAVNIAANDYDFVNLYGVEISCADGTIPDPEYIFLPTLVGLNTAAASQGLTPGYAAIVGNTGSPDNVVCAAAFVYGMGALWLVDGFQLTGVEAGIISQPASVALIKNLDFAGTFATFGGGLGAAILGNGGCISAYDPSYGTISVSSDMPYFISTSIGIATTTVFDFDLTVVTFENSPAFSQSVVQMFGGLFEFRQS